MSASSILIAKSIWLEWLNSSSTVEMGMPLDSAEAVRAAFLAEPAYLEAALEAYDDAPLVFPNADSFKKQILSV